MIPKYGSGGNFDDFLPHELLIHAVRSRFSGSIELKYGSDYREIRFSGGKIGSTSSTFHTEKIDKIIERSISPGLTDQQREQMLELVSEGMKYGQAVVESGILSAAELLRFNDDQAELICANVLNTEPERYDLRQESTSKYRPLRVDLIALIHKSLLNDIADEKIAEHLGADESTVFMPSEEKKISSPSIMEDQELQTIMKHLDGQRTVAELSRRVGFNPERTARALLFLKMIDWIEPVISNRSAFMEKPADIAAVTTGKYQAEQDLPPTGEQDAGILKLLGDDDVSLEADGADKQARAKKPPSSPEEAEMVKPFKSFMEPEEEQKEKSISRFLLHPVTLSAAALLIVIAGLLFSGVLNSGGATEATPVATEMPTEEMPPSEIDLSYYDERIDEEQLPLDADFSRERPVRQPGVKITPAADEEAAEKKSETGNEERPGTTASPEKETDIPAKTETEPELQPEAQTQETPPAPPLQQIQSKSLEYLLAARWQAASDLWEASLRRHHTDEYTLRIYTTRNGPDVSGVFERFANSARLRKEFYVLQQSNGDFVICWGLFNSADTALDALRGLPPRISEYSPSLARVETVLP